MLRPMSADVILYGTLGICGLAIVVMIYRYDLYDKEPWYMAVVAVALGAGMMWAMGPLEMLTIRALGEMGTTNLSIAVIAATHEGLGKFLVVLLIALVCCGVFNDPADGIIYGSLVGLGAGLMESVAELGLTSGRILLPGAEIVRLLGHAVFGGITGYGLGAVVARRRGWRLVALATLLAAMALHATWDMLALTQTPSGSGHGVAAAGVMVAGLLVFGTLVVRAARESRRHFRPGQHHRLFGWPLNRIFRD
jgi:RsiW-degrading membrane proteinase PrsW (M82 family)